MNRYAVRCADCLSVSFIEAGEEPRWTWSPATGRVAPLQCAACDGPVSSMGRVQAGRLKRSGLEVPCDARCTNARGPSCDCSCGGRNHGSQLLVSVEHDLGAVPRVRPVDADRARAHAAEFRAARDHARAEIEGRFPQLAQKARGDRVLDWTRFLEGKRLMGRLHEAADLRVHGMRMKRLAEVEAIARCWVPVR